MLQISFILYNDEIIFQRLSWLYEEYLFLIKFTENYYGIIMGFENCTYVSKIALEQFSKQKDAAQIKQGYFFSNFNNGRTYQFSMVFHLIKQCHLYLDKSGIHTFLCILTNYYNPIFEYD